MVLNITWTFIIYLEGKNRFLEFKSIFIYQRFLSHPSSQLKLFPLTFYRHLTSDSFGTREVHQCNISWYNIYLQIKYKACPELWLSTMTSASNGVTFKCGQLDRHDTMNCTSDTFYVTIKSMVRFILIEYNRYVVVMCTISGTGMTSGECSCSTC